ncbi:MAG TPA: hypothetical protein VG938_12145 [Verrucomicrobiae bacterium]|nr:hypothetical protein [Verrucomicrobiae bacterium]
MRITLAIVCSLLLAWTNIVPAETPGTSVACAARICCHCGKKSDCCATNRSLPESQPVSAAPASSSQNQFSSLTQTITAWTLPTGIAHEHSSSFFPPLTTAGAPLFARNCARLI